MRLAVTLPTAVGGLVLAAAALVPSTASAHATPTCHGLAATIVGTGRVTGTAGADVIVTRGVARVEARGGDDTICVTSVGHTDEVPTVDAGAGNDYVANLSDHEAWAYLGPGDDEFVGGPAREEVDDGGPYEDGPADLGRDTISTGGGDDSVQTGELGVSNSDRVDTGAGDDRIEVRTIDDADATLAGGAGSDVLTAYLFTPSGDSGEPQDGSWVFDNRAGTATLDGTVQLRWSGMEQFPLYWFGGSAHSFLGSDADEYVGTDRPDVIQGGGGDDTLGVSSPVRSATTFDGGPGHDRLSASSSGDQVLTVDVDPAHVAFVTQPGGYGSDEEWDLAGFEEYAAHAPEVVLHGSAGPDVLTGAGCLVTVEAGDGDDRATGTIAPDDDAYSCPDKHVSLHGGAGDDLLRSAHGSASLSGDDGDDRLLGLDGADVLLGGRGDDIARGGPGDDVILGGTGRDAAYGGPDTDRCRAEQRESCEGR